MFVISQFWADKFEGRQPWTKLFPDWFIPIKYVKIDI